MKGDKMMKTSGLILVTAILLIAENSFGQDCMNLYTNLANDISAPPASQNLAIAEEEESRGQPVSNSWHGKHNIQLNIGLLSDFGVENETSADGMVNMVGGDGFLGSIAYSYWTQDDLAFGVSVGVIGSEVSTSVSGSRVSLETSSVISVLFGIKYQPLKIISEGVGPYIFLSVGPSVGSATQSFTGSGLKNETYSETAIASHFGLGTDFVLSRLFVTGLSVGYYLTTDFDRPIGPQKNYSSPEFTLSIGILLGGGKK
jgi:hypothetical protein